MWERTLEHLANNPAIKAVITEQGVLGNNKKIFLSIVFWQLWHRLSRKEISHNLSSICPFWNASAVLMTVTRKKSEVCQERSSDMGAGAVCSACGLDSSANMVQTTAATCLHFAKCWRQRPPPPEGQGLGPNTEPKPKTITPSFDQIYSLKPLAHCNSSKRMTSMSNYSYRMSCCSMRICCVSPEILLSHKERVNCTCFNNSQNTFQPWQPVRSLCTKDLVGWHGLNSCRVMLL